VSSSPSVHIEVEVYNNYDLLLQKYIGNSVSSETTSVEIIDDRLEYMLLSWNQELIINDSFSSIPFSLGYYISLFDVYGSALLTSDISTNFMIIGNGETEGTVIIDGIQFLAISGGWTEINTQIYHSQNNDIIIDFLTYNPSNDKIMLSTSKEYDDLTFRVNLVLDEGDDIILTPVPEPTTLSLLAIGGLLLRRRKTQ
jgi:hypothetical protein